MKSKGGKTLFGIIIGIFVLSIIIIPLGATFQKQDKSPSDTKENATTAEEFATKGFEGTIVKQDSDYFLEVGEVRLMKIKSDGKIKLDKYIDKNVRVFGELTADTDGTTIILTVSKVSGV